jgi:hypothetical protein
LLVGLPPSPFCSSAARLSAFMLISCPLPLSALRALPLSSQRGSGRRTSPRTPIPRDRWADQIHPAGRICALALTGANLDAVDALANCARLSSGRPSGRCGSCNRRGMTQRREQSTRSSSQFYDTVRKALLHDHRAPCVKGQLSLESAARSTEIVQHPERGLT